MSGNFLNPWSLVERFVGSKLSPVLFRCGADLRRGPSVGAVHVKLRVAARQIYGGIRVSAAYIFATLVVIVILMCLVNLSERLLPGSVGDGEDLDTEQYKMIFTFVTFF